jgi:hypothetical protein
LRLSLIPVCYHSIVEDIKTPTGKDSLPLQLKHFYPIHRILYEKAFRPESYKEGFRFNTKTLTLLFGSGKEVKEVLEYLQNHNYLLKLKEHNQLRHQSATYTLHPSIEDSKCIVVDYDSSESSLIIKLEKRIASARDATCKKQLKLIENNVRINDNGMQYLIGKYPDLESGKPIWIEPVDIQLYSIYSRNYFVTRPDFKSRVYHNLTSLKREHRAYIDFDGLPMLMTDISNSQILMSILEMIKFQKIISGIGICTLTSDLKRFKELCESGQFYEYLIQKSCYKGDRNDFKKLFFQEVYYSRNNNWKNQNIKEIFKKEFPTVFATITKMKKKDYKEFSKRLQRFEANVVIDGVYRKLLKENVKCLTLHDAIICNNKEDLLKAERLISQELLKFNICPHFKKEH